DRVVRKCLAKDRERRWQSAADLSDELTWIAQSPQASPSAAPTATAMPPPSRRPILPALAVVTIVALVSALAWSIWRGQPRAGAGRIPRTLAIEVPDGLGTLRGGLAVSPDGRTIVFASGGSGPLYVRRAGAPGAVPIAKTEGARTPFFSFDGQS